MTARELQGCAVESHKGGSGHLTVVRGDRRSQLPMHRSNKDLGTGPVNKIKKGFGARVNLRRQRLTMYAVILTADAIIEQMDQALHAVGKRLVVSVHDAA
jgi:mRNA interferase HicA